MMAVLSAAAMMTCTAQDGLLAVLPTYVQNNRLVKKTVPFKYYEETVLQQTPGRSAARNWYCEMKKAKSPQMPSVRYYVDETGKWVMVSGSPFNEDSSMGLP